MSVLQTGVFNAIQGNPAELNKRSFAGTILRRHPNGSAPIFALTSQSGRSKAVSTTHGYFSKTMLFVTLNGTAIEPAAETSIAVTSSAGVTPKMVFQNLRTGENIRVISITDATTIVVSRSFGRVAAADTAVSDKFIQVGTAFEEGSLRPVARRISTIHIPNYTQIFRNAWALTDTARASYAEAGYSNIAESRSDCMVFHSVDIESALIWGQAEMDTTGATPLHSTQGIIDAMEQYAPQNTNAASSTTNYAQLITLVEPAFRSSANVGNAKGRVLFGDNQTIKVITDIGRKSGQVQIMQNETQFGMKFTSFQFYLGTIDLVIHPLFNGNGLAGTALIMDMPALKLAYMDGRDTKPEEYNTGGKLVEGGIDAVGGSLTTELAVELINPYSCAYITGLTAGVAEA